jgi:hypothetical protein
VNPLLLLLCVTLVGMQAGLSRRWAFLPLLIAACHTPYTPFMGGMTVARLVILSGLLRGGVKGWLAWSPRNPLDLLVAAFAAIALASTAGHAWEPYNPLIIRLRLVLDVVGTYLYMRAYLSDHESMERLAAGLAIILMPFAFLLLAEKQSGLNPYAAIGAGNLHSLVRDGGFRAQGPFGTPILAGTVGAVAMPLLIPLLNTRRRLAISGLVAAGVVVYASASSGPISTAAIGLGVVYFWRWKQHLRSVLTVLCIGLIILHFVKERPIWYLMALMDLVGGSTGWHRAYLIDMAVKHLGEWWLIGTDYTRHWMPYGLEAVPEHCDLTNYYIQLGVTSGLSLVACLIAIQWKSFRLISSRMRDLQESDTTQQYALWCLGAVLSAHAITFLSISYFDQIYVFFWGLLGGLTGFLTPRRDDHCLDDGDAAELVTGDAAKNAAWQHQHEANYPDFRASAR